MNFNKNQIIVVCIALALTYIFFLMSKDVMRNYDKEKIDLLRKEYIDQRLEDYKYQIMPKYKDYEFKAEAEMKYPYGEDFPATSLLFFKFKGEYYKFKFLISFFCLATAGLIIYNLREK
ncbi:MAG TPA: hypothetical protein PLC32_02735 [Candidatus Omnitrophota bacterium]|nr:hypothetical protein [Candidatus Omnitrophota bacterium]